MDLTGIGSIVVFDSTVPIGSGGGVYMEATAAEQFVLDDRDNRVALML
jgi:hypothetical protein